MLPEIVERRYDEVFQHFEENANNPLVLSGWYCIALWLDKFARKSEQIYPSSDEIIMLFRNTKFRYIISALQLFNLPYLSDVNLHVHLVKIVRYYKVNQNIERAIYFYRDYLCCALSDIGIYSSLSGFDGALYCSLIRLCMLYAGDRLGTPAIIELQPINIYNDHHEVMDYFHVPYEEFELIWNSVHSCKSSSPARSKQKVLDAVKIYGKFKASPQYLLEQYAHIVSLDSAEISNSNNPLEYIYQKSKKYKHKEGGLADLEKKFLNAAYQISREAPVDVVQNIFYRNRDDSKLECMIARTEIVRAKLHSRSFLVVNPSPMFLQEFSKTDVNKYQGVAPQYRVFMVVLDEVLCTIYGRQFPAYSFICLNQLTALSEMFDCVAVFARDYEPRSDLWEAFRFCKPNGSVIAVVPQTAFTQKDETFVDEWRSNGIGIRSILDVPKQLSNSKPAKKALVVGMKIDNPSKYFRLLNAVTDPTGDWVIYDKHHDRIPFNLLSQHMTLAQMRNAVRNNRIPETREIQSYSFSQEIKLEYMFIRSNGEIEGARASYRTIHRPKLHPQSTKGKRIVKNYESGLRGKSIEEILPKLEFTALSEYFYTSIVNDVKDYYQGNYGQVTLKTLWYCCREELTYKLSYDDDVARYFFCGGSRALSDLRFGECSADDIHEAMKALYGDDEIPKKIWLQLYMILQTAVEEGMIEHNPLATFMVVVKNQNRERLYLLNAALKKSHFTDDEEARMIAFLREQIPVPGRRKERAARYVVESKWLLGAISLFAGIPVREICPLHWGDIRRIEDDLDEMQMVISKHLSDKGGIIANVHHKNKHLFRKIPIDTILAQMLMDRKSFLQSRYGCTDESLEDAYVMLDEEPARGRGIYKCKTISKSTANDAKKKLLQIAKISEETISLLEGEAKIDVNLNSYRTDLFAANFRHKAIHQCGFTEGELCFHMGNRGPDTFSNHYCDYSDDFLQYNMVRKLYRWSYVYDTANSAAKSVRKCGTVNETTEYNSGRYTTGRVDVTLGIVPSEDAEGTILVEVNTRHGSNIDAAAYMRED